MLFKIDSSRRIDFYELYSLHSSNAILGLRFRVGDKRWVSTMCAHESSQERLVNAELLCNIIARKWEFMREVNALIRYPRIRFNFELQLIV